MELKKVRLKMARYIDLDDDEIIYCGNDGEYERYNIPTDIRTADVVERKKGEWVACDHDKWMHGVYALRCLNCNGGYHLSTEQTIGTWDFCPTCGADMRKEVK